uniref:Natural resistance-associated macrophage protein 2 (inferred by orthology to a human protein) n=1 Tax=Strongyloides venezuelensis TaxID=75913 RepID=A0A0K0FD37_STRVS
MNYKVEEKEEIKDIPEDILDVKVCISNEDDSRFINWKKLWSFTGPGLLMSIAYLDPGNIESDLQSGAMTQYRLIWVLLSAHILGLILQRLAARVGVVTGKHMAEIAYHYYPKYPRWLLWIMVEIAIIASDMQEVIGTAIALYLLSNKIIPLWCGVLITIVDTFTFLFLDKYGIRKFELFFAFLISVMAITFGFQFFSSPPPFGDVLEGTFLPWCENCDSDQILQGVSIIGAVVMPHNFYLHSALVKSRDVDRSNKKRIVEANKYFFIDSTISLTISFIINLFVVSVFGKGLYGKSNADVYNECQNPHNGLPHFYRNVFPNNNDTAISDIYHAGVFLGCSVGVSALYIWAIGIIASGQSSTMTGTYAGQFAMEGFLQIRISRWKRILITRSLAILPTIIVTIFSQGVDHITGLNDLLNAVMMIQLPFAIFPVITFTADRHLMHSFHICRFQKVFTFVVSIFILAINYYFLYEYIQQRIGNSWYYWILVAIFAFLYTAFTVYIAIYCTLALEIVNRDTMGRTFKKVFPNPMYDQFKKPWIELVK